MDISPSIQVTHFMTRLFSADPVIPVMHLNLITYLGARPAQLVAHLDYFAGTFGRYLRSEDCPKIATSIDDPGGIKRYDNN